MKKEHPITTQSSATDVANFVRQAKQLAPRRTAGRLLFALDATASRQPTWDSACKLQGEMFTAAAEGGGSNRLSVQLAWYRGFADFHAAPWADETATLLAHMNRVQCAGGTTQIERVFEHAVVLCRSQRLNALVFVGDCVEEPPQRLYPLAGKLKLLGVPAFMFQEGGDAHAAGCFREIAALSGGAYSTFDAGSAAQLKDLLRAVAVYASGGRRALRDAAGRNRAAALLGRQLGRGA